MIPQSCNPQCKRLAHHLAILSKHFTIEQLSLYLRALTSTIAFDSANTSVLTLFHPVLEGKHDATPQSSYIEILIKTSGMMFKKKRIDEFADNLHEWKIELIHLIHGSGSDFKLCGVLIMACNAAALYELGRSKSGEPLLLIRGAQEIRTIGNDPCVSLKETPSISIISPRQMRQLVGRSWTIQTMRR